MDDHVIEIENVVPMEPVMVCHGPGTQYFEANSAEEMRVVFMAFDIVRGTLISTAKLTFCSRMSIPRRHCAGFNACWVLKLETRLIE